MGYDAAVLPCCDAPSPAAAAALSTQWAARARWRLGMPQLDACGLSEHWLQKACGDRHWQALARLCGRAPQDWRDVHGQRVYAAFAYLRLGGARLAQACEGEVLQVRSEAHAIGRSQAWSRHQLGVGGARLGCLDLLSVFVGRADGFSNRSVRRVELRNEDTPPPPAAAALLARAKLLRGAVAQQPAMATVDVLPCPRNDFNGAGLLYFASFTALADRALWQWGRLTRQEAVLERECAFLGNLDPGTALRIGLVEQARDGAATALTLRLAAADDERPLAVMRLRVGQDCRRGS